MSQVSSNKILDLAMLFEQSVDAFPNNIAIEWDQVSITYCDLDQRANQLAYYLILKGVKARAYVGVVIERSVDSYIAMLAILKAGAVYVPIETEHPDERINYILADLPLQAVITSKQQHARLQIQFSNPIIVDEQRVAIAQQPTTRPSLISTDHQQLCYVIYTSGSTGKPKGVEIMHRSICHYVSVASALYNMTSQDKVYQGFSLAFDASMEEVWMALANGATSVVCTSKDIRFGVGLVCFLIDHQVTVFSTVPTLLSSLENKPVPSLRLLILGGEMCSSTLIKQHSRHGLRIVNTYGPTESTVIATLAECHPDQPVTIGKPIPGYSVFILDSELQQVEVGQAGELCIAGIGLARGYVNHPEITAAKFIPHPHDANERLYRTGDLCSINADGDILFLGRIDEQVKIRGFRIELNEIETVISTYDGIKNAVVGLYDIDNTPSLVAYLIVDQQADFDLKEFRSFLQQKLPHYMVPAMFHRVTEFPLLSNGKVDRKALPKPQQVKQDMPYLAPKTSFEKSIASVFESILQRKQISIDADFFYDLGGHSLSAARVISDLRKISAFGTISILDLYKNPTVQKLAGSVSEKIAEPSVKSHEKNHTSTLQYMLCGGAQLVGCLFQYAMHAWQMVLVFLCYEWFRVDSSYLSMQSISLFIGLFFTLPIVTILFKIAIKWLLLGKIKPGRYKLWGWFYLRWWLVRRIHNFLLPPKYLMGTSLVIIYYRLLGAKIGSNCYIGTPSIAAYDLLTIGDNTSIGYDAKLFGYDVSDGYLTIGSISIGKHCYIGSRTMLGLNTVVHDHAKLDNMTMVTPQTRVPDNAFLSGSPARPIEMPLDHITNVVNEQTEDSLFVNNIYYGMRDYLAFLLVGFIYYVSYLPGLAFILYIQHQTHAFMSILFTAPIGAFLTMGLYFSLVYICKKSLLPKIKPGMYAVKSGLYLRQWIITKLLDADEVAVLADSLYFPMLLRCLGANIGKQVEMGEVPHLVPDLITLHDEAFSASSVGMAWPNIHEGQIQFLPITIGKHAFTGNVSLLPAGSELGSDSLLGCLTMPPSLKQATEKGTSWLGSPPMYLPRREEFTDYAEEYTTKPTKSVYLSRLAIELIRVILPTTYILTGFVTIFSIFEFLYIHSTLLMTVCLMPLVECLVILLMVSTILALKWMVQGRIKSTIKPLWDLFIRRIDLIEYSWSYFVTPHLAQLLLGTPFFPMLVRCFGAKIGKKVFIETEKFAEFDLISIGDEVCINADTLIDTHLYEDRIFKTSTIDIQEGCSVGMASIILYDTVMEPNSSLGGLSLLMKGERLPANTKWQGLPAQTMHTYEEKVH